MVNPNLIPKELRENEEFAKGLDELSNSFYQMLQEAGNTIISSTGLTEVDSLGIIFKTLVANTCKEAFNQAYVRYISNGG